MKKILLIACVCVLACAFVLTGCLENYKTDAIETDWDGISSVESNGGIAVKAGKYLYYVNGYAGTDSENTFGDAVKGAIGRVELDENGDVKADTNTIVVPKNVYNTVATSGLYIDGNYIYYSTFSIAEKSDGTKKTDVMWLMRTKLDGTDTEIVKEFDDFTAEYKVVNGYVVYYLKNELHSIDLNSKKFTDTTVVSEISSVKFTYFTKGANGFADAVFFIKASEQDNATNNTLWIYRAGGEAKLLIEANATSYGDTLLYPAGYTLALVEYSYVGDGIRLVYTKTDSGKNTISKGTYSYDFTADLSFDKASEVRYTYLSNITALNFLNDSNLIAVNGTNVDWFKKGEDGKWISQGNVIVASTAPTIFDIVDDGSTVTVYYVTSDNYIFSMKVLSKAADGTYAIAKGAAGSLYSGGYDKTWLTYDKVCDNVYFFNANVLNNVYYVDLYELVARDSDSQIPTLLGIMTEADEVSMLTK